MALVNQNRLYSTWKLVLMDFAVKALTTLTAAAVIGDYCVFDLRL